MSFFSSFPIEAYNFGNEVDFSFIQNLSSYVDIIDSVKDQVSFFPLSHHKFLRRVHYNGIYRPNQNHRHLNQYLNLILKLS